MSSKCIFLTLIFLFSIILEIHANYVNLVFDVIKENIITRMFYLDCVLKNNTIRLDNDVKYFFFIKTPFSILFKSIKLWIWIHMWSELGINLKCTVTQYYVLLLNQQGIWRIGNFLRSHWKETDNRIIECEWIPKKKMWSEMGLY